MEFVECHDPLGLLALRVREHEEVIAETRGVHHGRAHPENAGDVLLVRVDHVRLPHGAHFKLLVPHVQHLGDGHGRLSVPLRGYVVEEELEVADDDELPEPALLDAAGLRHLHVSFVGRPDPSSWIDA